MANPTTLGNGNLNRRERETSMNYGTTLTLDLPFDQTVARVREVLARHGFGILTEIDVRATLHAKLGADVEDYVILGACNPPVAHRALEADLSIGLLLPCNVVVRAHGGGSLVEIQDPQLMATLSDAVELQAVAQDASRPLTAGAESSRPRPSADDLTKRDGRRPPCHGRRGLPPRGERLHHRFNQRFRMPSVAVVWADGGPQMPLRSRMTLVSHPDSRAARRPPSPRLSAPRRPERLGLAVEELSGGHVPILARPGNWPRGWQEQRHDAPKEQSDRSEAPVLGRGRHGGSNRRWVLAVGKLTAQGDSMARARWSDLDPRRRPLILIGAAVEGGLKIAALIDLARRPARDVRGSKPLWAAAIAVINLAGAVPIGY